MRVSLTLTVLVSVALLGAPTKAIIMDVVECRDSRDVPLPSDYWGFDFDAQVLTITVVIDERGSDPSDPFRRLGVSVTGQQDTPSILTIVENIINETGVPFTGYKFNVVSPIWSYSEIVPGTVQATNSPQVHRLSLNSYELAWSTPIPDQGTFSVQFDVLNHMWNPEGHWNFAVGQIPVPEPATMTLLGFAGLALLRMRRSVRGQHKNLKVE